MVTNSWPASGVQLLPLMRPFPCLRPALLCEAPTEPPGSLQQPPQLPITSEWVPRVQSAAPHPFLLSRELPRLLFPESQGRGPAGQRPCCWMGNGGWMGR